MSQKSCVNCALLRGCKRVDEIMVELRDSCNEWEDANSDIVAERLWAIKTLGPASVLKEPNQKHLKEVQRMALVKRTLLRKLATKAGLIEASPAAFALRHQDLIELLTPDFEGIEDLDEKEIEELHDSLPEPEKDEKPKKKKTTRRTRKTAAKKEEAEEADEEKPTKKPARTRKAAGRKTAGRKTVSKEKEEKEEKEEEKPKPKRTRKTAARKPARTRKTAASKKKEEDEGEKGENNGEGIDLTPIIERLDAIGPYAAQAKEAAEGLSAQVSELGDKVGLIEQYLIWKHNEEFAYNDDGELEEDWVVESLEDAMDSGDDD